MAAGIALGAWLAVGEPAEAQARPEARYSAVNLDGIKLFLNTATGDTWRFITSPNQGWQYHALPKRIDACVVETPGCLP